MNIKDDLDSCKMSRLLRESAFNVLIYLVVEVVEAGRNARLSTGHTHKRERGNDRASHCHSCSDYCRTRLPCSHELQTDRRRSSGEPAHAPSAKHQCTAAKLGPMFDGRNDEES
jgi:hypothetical protein